MKKPPKQPKKPAGKGKKDQKRKGKKKKQTYQVRNWREYNQALVDRGSVMFWITEEAIEQWEEKHKTGKRGKPRTYSNTAIETALTLQQVFHLPLRQTEGFVRGILVKLGASVQAPDYSTLSVRGMTLPVQIRVREPGKEPLHIVVDSSGAKVYGEGEWKVRQHGWGKHRTWKKLHIGVDEATKDILLGEVTGNDTADCEMLEPLLDQLPASAVIGAVSADGAYDKRMCYATLQDHDVSTIAIPPQHNAKIWQHGNTKGERLARDENRRRIRAIGRKQWKVEINYHRRSIAENAMFRLKTVFGERISARTDTNQRTQLLIRFRALNRMTARGIPDSVLVA